LPERVFSGRSRRSPECSWARSRASTSARKAGLLPQARSKNAARSAVDSISSACAKIDSSGRDGSIMVKLLSRERQRPLATFARSACMICDISPKRQRDPRLRLGLVCCLFTHCHILVRRPAEEVAKIINGSQQDRSAINNAADCHCGLLLPSGPLHV